LRKLRRQGPDRYEVEPLRGNLEVRDWEPQDWKLSTRIMEIAKPLTDQADDNDQFELAVTMAVLCWNLASLPPDRRERELQSLVRKMAKGAPKEFADEMETWGRILVDRKRRLFADDSRMVMKRSIVRDGNNLRLSVIGALGPR
jgi:hypothetical protein